MKADAEDYEKWQVPNAPLCEMNCSPCQTHFALWSPRARSVVVNLYEHDMGGEKVFINTLHTANSWQTPILHTANSRQTPILLHKRSNGMFSAVVNADLRGMFYTFTVTDENGYELEETPGISARAVGANGLRAQVLDMATTNPDGWEYDERPSTGPDIQAAAIIYEMHHRDFSAGKDSGIRNKGKYLALTETGTHNSEGLATGIDHLKELGITHVHLLPSYDFGSIDETNTDNPQYNWGYDPVNYNVPEGSYSTNPHEPTTRIREFKQMVMALHQAGIRVVMDVVYNHVYDLQRSNFQRTAPGYFFRWNKDGTPSNASGCGSETASERPMMRKFMVESVRYWAEEYHIDGFRFDLMGIHDIDTMNSIRRALDEIDPTILIYGEGWTADKPALEYNRLALKTNIAKMPRIAAFCDEMRDALRGPWDTDKKGAFLTGRAGHEESIRFGLCGACRNEEVDMQKVNYSQQPWAILPQQMISYVSCHDDLCLTDRLMLTTDTRRKNQKEKEKEWKRLHKLAYTAVLTSKGIPLIWCGDEMMRNRHGIRNCYNQPDSINAIPWSLKTKNREVFDYIKNLIQLRKKYKWYDCEIHFPATNKSNVIACHFTSSDSQSIVVLNSNKSSITQVLPAGRWSIALSSSGKPAISDNTIIVPLQSAVVLERLC